MKGIVTVNKHDLDKHPGLEESLVTFSEAVQKHDNMYRFHSKEGSLMTLICTLLDKEVVYTLSFENVII